jgi:hypothetical protein
MAPYQSLKLYLVNTFGISKVEFHFGLGFLIYFVLAKLFRIKLSSFKSLIAPIAFAFLMEVMDVRDAMAYGFKVNWADSVKDIFVTTSLPVFIYLCLKITKKKTFKL